MPAYTTITNGLVAVGAKPFATTMQALRDNPLAIAEGDVTAPKILGQAAARDFNEQLPLLTVTAGEVVSAQGEGRILGTLIVANNAGTVVAVTYKIKSYTGTLRFKASHRIVTAGTSTLQIFKNGTLVQGYTSTSTTAQERINDVTIVPGDVIEWRHTGSGAAGQSQVTNPLVCGNIVYVEQFLYRPSGQEVV